jgi:hypothetical protein
MYKMQTLVADGNQFQKIKKLSASDVIKNREPCKAMAAFML